MIQAKNVVERLILLDPIGKIQFDESKKEVEKQKGCLISLKCRNKA